MSKYTMVKRGDSTVIIGNVKIMDITELYREGPQKYLCGMLSGKYDEHIFSVRNKSILTVHISKCTDNCNTYNYQLLICTYL